MPEPHNHHITSKNLKIILIIITVIFAVISILGLFFFGWFVVVILPISFLLYAAFQATSDHLVEYHKICPKCDAKNVISIDICHKCGFIFPLYENKDKP